MTEKNQDNMVAETKRIIDSLIAPEKPIEQIMVSVTFVDGTSQHAFSGTIHQHAFVIASQQTLLQDRLRRDMRL